MSLSPDVSYAAGFVTAVNCAIDEIRRISNTTSCTNERDGNFLRFSVGVSRLAVCVWSIYDIYLAKNEITTDQLSAKEVVVLF